MDSSTQNIPPRTHDALRIVIPIGSRMWHFQLLLTLLFSDRIFTVFCFVRKGGHGPKLMAAWLTFGTQEGLEVGVEEG